MNDLHRLSESYKVLIAQSGWLRSFVFGVCMLLLSFIFSICSGRYASSIKGPRLGDILLDNLPLWDVSLFHIYVATFFWWFILIISLLKPKILCFALKTTAFFLTIRSAFVIMTHMGPPENLLNLPTNVASLYIYNGDLFFSGHVGGPFLFALIFWQEKYLRIFCLVAAIFFSCVVLLGGIHYSIDVFASYFISHSIFMLSKKIFVKDYILVRV